MLSFFLRDVLDEIRDLSESVKGISVYKVIENLVEHQFKFLLKEFQFIKSLKIY